MLSAKILRIMISYPSDVLEEADAIDLVVAELNRSSGNLLGLRFETIRWDRDSVPGIGADPQQVINSQFANAFDILVAIFWTRMGSPTPRAPSGAFEEIKIAVDRIEKNVDSAKLFVYFKTTSPELERIDPTQLKGVRELREWLSSKGVLFKTFEELESLKSSLRVNLVQAAKDLLGSAGSKHLRESPSDPPAQVGPAVEDELGLLDYLDIHESRMAAATASMEGISATLESLRQSLDRRTGEINDLNSKGGMNRGELRRLLQRSADDWEEVSRKISKFLSDFSKASADSFAALSSAVPLMSKSTEAAANQRIQLAGTLEHLATTFEATIESNNGFRTIIASFPRMIVEHNRAKRELIHVLDDAEGQFRAVRVLASDIALALRSI